MAKRKNAGFSEARGGILLKMVLTILIALVMTSTVFVPVMGSNAANVDENNSGAGDSSFDNDTSSKDFNISAPETIDIEHREPYIPYVDDEDSPVIVMDRPDYVVKNETEENTLSENPPIEMSDMSCHPLELPDLKDTHLSWRDMINWERLFPKFMAMEGKNNVLSVELKNVDDNRTYDVKLDIYEISPEGNKTLIGEEHYGMMFPSQKTSNVDIWVPENAGRNYIYGEIYVSTDCSFSWFGPEKEWVLVNTFKKSFNVVPGDRPVRIINGDWTVEQPTIIESETVIVNGDMYVNAPLEIRNTTVLGDDLNITASYVIDANSEHDMKSWNITDNYSVNVYSTGTLNVYGELCNNPNDIYYNFYVYGNLTVDKDPYAEEAGSISEVNGDPDNLDAPGGIIVDNAVGKVEIRNGATIYNCLSHALWVENSRAEIYDATIRDNGGDGIVAKNMSVIHVSDSNISWNGRYGINIDGGIVDIKKTSGENKINWNGLEGIHISSTKYLDPYGKPNSVTNAETSYLLWYDDDLWHLWWVSDGETHDFNGTVQFFDLKNPISVEPFELDLNGDDYTISKDSIVFNATESSGEEGFNFTFSGEVCSIVFDLTIDGKRYVDEVILGSDKTKPASIPFVISPNSKIQGITSSFNMGSGIHIEDSYGLDIENSNISRNGNGLVFNYDVENGDSGWESTGLWNRVRNGTKRYSPAENKYVWDTPTWNISHSGNWSWWYGFEHNDTGDYNTTDENGNSTTNYGTLESPEISIPSTPYSTLSFWSWHETEPENMNHPDTNPPEPQPPIVESTDGQYDIRYVKIEASDGSYSTYILKGDISREWTRFVLDISQYSGENIHIIFGFYTKDNLYNDYQGWYVDDVKLISAAERTDYIDGIHIENSEHIAVKDNSIFYNNYCGMFAWNVKNTELIHNKLYENVIGLVSADSNVLSVKNNTVKYSIDFGMYLLNSSSCIVDNNTMEHTYGTGLVLDSSSSLPIVDNLQSMPDYPYIENSDKILLKLKENDRPSESVLNYINGESNLTITRYYEHLKIYEISVRNKNETNTTLKMLSSYPDVEFAEKDSMFFPNAIPDDPYFDLQWALRNTGQEGGTASADINAEKAWNISKGSRDIVVAVIDSGIYYNHPDLNPNIWRNPGETGVDSNGMDKATNGIDDDNDGYVDDVYGMNAVADNGDPMDDMGHGTHCAGIIGAVGNNSTGITGINWNVSIMPVKFISSRGFGYTSDAIESMEYVIAMKESGVNVKVISASWGSSRYSQALYDAIASARDEGILFVAASGNMGRNTDYYAQYPSDYNLTNIISVAATDRNDEIAYFSDYGRYSVDVAAPGVDIYSTIYADSYAYKSGTSMATPYVAGLAALIYSEYPDEDSTKVKNRILVSADKIPSLKGKVLSEGRINAYSALRNTDDDLHVFLTTISNNSVVRVDTPVTLMVSLCKGTDPITDARIEVRSPEGTSILLHDDGVGPDQVPGDGYYTGTFTPKNCGNEALDIDITKDEEEIYSTKLHLQIIGDVVVSNNTIEESGFGAEIYHCSHLVFYNNTVLDSDSYGIRTDSPKHMEISYNTVKNSDGKGLALFRPYDVTIYGNTVENSSFDGIFLYESEHTETYDNTLINNGLKGSYNGINLDHSYGQNYIHDNTCRENSLSGIIETDSSNALIENNTCEENGLLGVFVYVSYYWESYSVHNEIIYNNCSGQEYGIGLLVNTVSYDNIIFHNNVSANEKGIATKIFEVPPNSEPKSGDSEVLFIQNSDYEKWGFEKYGYILNILNNTIRKNREIGIYGYTDGKCEELPKLNINGNSIEYNYVGISSNGTSLQVKNNTVSNNNGTGILMDYCEGNISENDIWNNNGWDWHDHDTYLSGIHMENSRNITIYDNSIVRNGDNIYIFNSTNISVEKNTVGDVSIQCQIYPSPPPTKGIFTLKSQVSIHWNEIYGTNFAIDITDSDGHTSIENNTVAPTPDGAHRTNVAISLHNASILLKNNTISEALSGIICDFGSDSLIYDNTISSDEDAIHITWSKPTIMHNSISSRYGWGVYSEYRKASNAGNHGEGLIDSNDFSYCGKGEIVQYWSLKIRVMEDDEPVSYGTLNITDNQNNSTFLPLNETGWTETVLLKQYEYNSSGDYITHIPYSVVLERDGNSESLSSVALSGNLVMTYYL